MFLLMMININQMNENCPDRNGKRPGEAIKRSIIWKYIDFLYLKNNKNHLKFDETLWLQEKNEW